MSGKWRSGQSEEQSVSAEMRQIHHDLAGVMRLGQMQAELLRSIQTRLGILSQERSTRGK
ncbi:MAG: hypothetical protein DWH81_02620 [Planctomycetota bacterium]|nr:MAG: hypothetical protein DWH81_02620 [Planctomycetota bacterium]